MIHSLNKHCGKITVLYITFIVTALRWTEGQTTPARRLSPFFLFLAPLRFTSMQAPSPLPQTRINSCSQIPLKILSPGCHLFSRGLDQIRPRAACREGGGTSVSIHSLENTTIQPYYITAHASMSFLWDTYSGKPSTERAFLPLVSRLSA